MAGVENALKEIEAIADFRLDMVRRADSMPGGWAAANIYERRVAGQSDTKNDKVWKSAVEEAAQTRKTKRKYPAVSQPDKPFSGMKKKKKKKRRVLYCYDRWVYVAIF